MFDEIKKRCVADEMAMPAVTDRLHIHAHRDRRHLLKMVDALAGHRPPLDCPFMLDLYKEQPEWCQFDTKDDIWDCDNFREERKHAQCWLRWADAHARG